LFICGLTTTWCLQRQNLPLGLALFPFLEGCDNDSVAD
jgi:hypothetical protein